MSNIRGVHQLSGILCSIKDDDYMEKREMFINKDLGEKTIESGVTITIKIRMDMGN